MNRIVSKDDNVLQDMELIVHNLRGKRQDGYRALQQQFIVEKNRMDSWSSFLTELPVQLRMNRKVSSGVVEKFVTLQQPLSILCEVRGTFVAQLRNRLINRNNIQQFHDVLFNAVYMHRFYAEKTNETLSILEKIRKLYTSHPSLKTQVNQFFFDKMAYSTLEDMVLLTVHEVYEYDILFEKYIQTLDWHDIDFREMWNCVTKRDETRKYFVKSELATGDGDSDKESLLIFHQQPPNVVTQISQTGEHVVLHGIFSKLNRRNMKKTIHLILTRTSVYCFRKLRFNIHFLMYRLPVDERTKVVFSDAQDYKDEFVLICRNKSLILEAKDSMERLNWINHLHAALGHGRTNVLTLGTDAPVMFPHTRFSNCTCCTLEFLVNKKLSCMACGRAVCDGCLVRQVSLKYIQDKADAKVCRKCFDLIDGNDDDSIKMRVYRNAKGFDIAGTISVSRAGGEYTSMWGELESGNLSLYNASEDEEMCEILHLSGFRLGTPEHHTLTGSDRPAFWLRHRKSQKEIISFKVSTCLGSTKTTSMEKQWINAIRAAYSFLQ